MKCCRLERPIHIIIDPRPLKKKNSQATLQNIFLKILFFNTYFFQSGVCKSKLGSSLNPQESLQLLFSSWITLQSKAIVFIIIGVGLKLMSFWPLEAMEKRHRRGKRVGEKQQPQNKQMDITEESLQNDCDNCLAYLKSALGFSRIFGDPGSFGDFHKRRRPSVV